MPYKFNNGKGAIICNKCRVIYLEATPAHDYANEFPNDEDHVCIRCKRKEEDKGDKVQDDRL